MLRRRLLLLRWAAETREEARRLASDLDPGHQVTQLLDEIARSCTELEELLENPHKI